MDKTTIETFKLVEAMGVWDETTPISLEEYTQLVLDEYVATTTEESRRDVREMLLQGNSKEYTKVLTEEYIKQLGFDELIRLPFDKAHKAIDMFTMAKRIKILEDLNVHRDYLYAQTDRYGQGDKETQISPATFRMMIGKIKHLEIIQTWLYGIK